MTANGGITGNVTGDLTGTASKASGAKRFQISGQVPSASAIVANRYLIFQRLYVTVDAGKALLIKNYRTYITTGGFCKGYGLAATDFSGAIVGSSGEFLGINQYIYDNSDSSSAITIILELGIGNDTSSSITTTIGDGWWLDLSIETVDD